MSDPHRTPVPPPTGSPFAAPPPGGQAPPPPTGYAAPPVGHGPPPPAGYTPPPPAGYAAPPPAPPRRRGWVLPVAIGAGILVLLAVVGGIVGWNALAAQYTPQAQAQRFLDALVAGRASDAAALVEGDAASSPLIDDALYAVTPDRIQAAEVRSTTQSDGSGLALVEVTQGGESYSVQLPLVSAGGVGPFGAFPDWRIGAQALAVMTVDVPRPEGVALVANGVPIASDGGARITAAVLPGGYAFGVDDRLLQLDGVGASAGLGGSATATGAVRLSAEGEAAARTAIDQFLAACIATTDIRPVPKCGMINDELDPATTYTEVVWSMTAAPTYRFEGWSSTLPGFPLTSLTGGAFRVDSAQWWWSWTDIELYGWLEYEDGAFTWVSDYRVE